MSKMAMQSFSSFLYFYKKRIDLLLWNVFSRHYISYVYALNDMYKLVLDL